LLEIARQRVSTGQTPASYGQGLRLPTDLENTVNQFSEFSGIERWVTSP
jgi:hypothetical protein